MPPPQLDDIQGFLRHGYPYFDRAAYCLFRIRGNRAGAKAWLHELLDPIASEPWIDRADLRRARIELDDCGVAIAFTASGLRELGLGDDALRTFVSEFQEGMPAKHRARLLGDVGASAPANWLWGNPQNIDGVLMVFSMQKRIDARVDEIQRLAGCPQLVGQLTGRLKFSPVSGVAKEPFGFADGISQPLIEGLNDGETPAGVRQIKPGEFVLGYLNEINRRPASPSVALADDPHNVLPRLPNEERADLGCNGTFMVMRQLEQDVQAFDDFVAGDECLAARMVGRWRTGAPLVRYPEEAPGLTQRELETENDFGYDREDRHGFTCPIGAHIRRANPRDALAEGLRLTPEQAQRLVDQHRILRRGRVYKENGRQGLVFICLNANIERQFEFVQSSWLMNGEFGGLPGETDPIIGNAPRRLTMQHPLLSESPQGLPQFVTVRGGAYFFMPGLRALRYLAQL